MYHVVGTITTIAATIAGGENYIQTLEASSFSPGNTTESDKLFRKIYE